MLMEFETLAIHDGQVPEPRTGAVSVPIYQTSTYEQDSIGHPRLGYDYSRSINPTRQALESALALVENGKHGLAFASGVAATVAALQVLKPGDQILAGNDTYGGTYRVFERIFRPWGVDTRYVDAADTDRFADAITPATRLIWIETPTNPLLKLADIAALASSWTTHLPARISSSRSTSARMSLFTAQQSISAAIATSSVARSSPRIRRSMKP
jgi:cystathionine beta-lyase/cystathionine gamma-synthase